MKVSDSRLLRPVLYLCIKHKDKRVYDVTIPLFVTALFLILSFVFGYSMKLQDIAQATNTILGVLPGFYIASLAAIATFNGQSIDSKLDGKNPPILFSCENGILKNRVLSRRRFLCFLFGYLSFVSISLCVVNIICALVKVYIFHGMMVIALQYVLTSAYIFFFSQMIITTFLGLFYLCDRLHWNQTCDPDEE